MLSGVGNKGSRCLFWILWVVHVKFLTLKIVGKGNFYDQKMAEKKVSVLLVLSTFFAE